MYLKQHQRKKNGKYHTYYSIAEKRKVSGGRYVEKRVLYLGEISSKTRIEAGEFDFKFDRGQYREMISRDGAYFLRTNQVGKEGAALWEEYMLQCHVEQAFKELKSDLGIRPVYHHKEDRVDAHVLVAFMSYGLQATLRHRLRANAGGLTRQAVLETLSRIQMLDVSFETLDGRTLVMQR